jgi:Flp pilus assembly protein TadG
MNTSFRNRRTAAVTVEFAIAAPILFLFVFTSVEFSRVNMIRNAIENAAYEGARRGVLPGASTANCESMAQEILDIAGINESTITVTPLVIQTSTVEVTVSVELPLAPNGYITPSYYLGKTLQVIITFPRE